MKFLQSVDAKEAGMIIEGLVVYIEKIETENIVNEEDEVGNPVTIAVTGPRGGKVNTLVMDGAIPISEGLALKKAYTAAVTGQSATVWNEPGEPEESSETTCISGADLLRVNDRVVGAVGISGRNPRRKRPQARRQDQELAELGVAIFQVIQDLSDEEKATIDSLELVESALERSD